MTTDPDANAKTGTDAPSSPLPPLDARYRAEILSVESGRLLGGGRVRLAPDSTPEALVWYLNTPFSADRGDVTLQFNTGLMREVTLVARASDEPYEYLIQWNGEGRLVPSSVLPDA